ncbi:hypothetical protein MKX50_01530 [Paenibacillus sp. FSL W8-0186]|uniref:Lipoprotein n=1 Tax=Paenibacillus woosongensis TaxID=307580 RepID=A0ABQ4MQM0_9BACL|nr:hypothetical protein [Paenibacillus woosongensis]GIP58288.1 hypothetical protein J15TS10_21020 [Paenibacillus woosongensis]
MKISRLMYLLLSILVLIGLSACQSSKSGPAQQPPDTGAVQNMTAGAQGHDEQRPEYLPADFPLPDDVKISTSHSEIKDGKKSVLLIFSTEEDMATITKLYKDYFKSQNLDDSGQTIGDKNIIIQGDNPDKNESWSMIGGRLSSNEGVIELNVTWTEL